MQSLLTSKMFGLATVTVALVAGGRSIPHSRERVQASNVAALPQIYLNTAVPVAPDAGGSIIAVKAGGDLQTALNAAKPGDVVSLPRGAVYTGNFVLPNKNTASSRWITIRPQASAGLPPEGSRMTPALAASASLPAIRTPNGMAAISTAPGAHHYRLIGLEVGLAAGVGVGVENFGLVLLGDGSAAQGSLALVPHDLVLDRLYIHGTPTSEVRRCVALNAASAAVVDSYVSECHEKGNDAQAIAGWNGPGPFKIVNNYLEGSGENVMFGGADPAIANLVPSDIEIRHNHLVKPEGWKGVWLVKNLLEFKNGQRAVIEGNVLENNWTSGQTGMAVALKSSNQSGGAPWSVTQDITLRYNVIRNVGGGMSLAGSPDPFGATTIDGRRFTVMDNVITGLNTGIFDGTGDGFLLVGDVQDVTLSHNTVISPTRAAVWFTPQGRAPAGPTVRTTIRDNMFGGGAYGVIGDGQNAQAAFNVYAPGGNLSGNVFVLSAKGYGVGNYFTPTFEGLGFLDALGGNFRLSGQSAFKGRAPDGRDPGADVDAVIAATAGVVVP